MRKIKLFTDSTADLTPEQIEKFDIGIIPLYITINDKALKDGVDISVPEMYEIIEKNKKLPKTSAPSPGDFYSAFKEFVDQGQDILYIGISSKISASIQNARIAGKEFTDAKVEVVDSYNLSTGIGLLVLKAADLINEGKEMNEIVESINKRIPKVKTAFVIDTLEYLYKGGRCNALESFFGGMLNIKPIVQVVDGSMILGQKARGKKQKALDTMLANVLDDKENIEPGRIFVVDSISEEDTKYVKQKLEEAGFNKENKIIISNAGCVISSHCGQGTCGIMYISK